MASGIGAYVLVPLNWHLTADELAYILNDSGTRALLAEAEFAGIAAEALKGTSGVAVRLAIGGEGPEGFESYDDLLAAASPDEPTEQAAGTYMFYTSGTTGRPKGVRSSSFVVGMPVSVHAAMLSGLAGMFQIPEGGVCLVNAPLYHGGPFLYSMLPAYRGATLVMRRRWDPEEMLRVIDEYRVTSAYAVPTHFVRLLRLPDEVRAAFDGSSLKG